ETACGCRQRCRWVQMPCVCSLGGMAAGIATCGGVGEIARKVVYGYHAVAQNIASLQQGVLFVSNATCRIHGISNITHVSGGVASQPPGTMILPDLPFCWLGRQCCCQCSLDGANRGVLIGRNVA